MSELVGFIGGGQMATALAKGAVQTGTIEVGHLCFADPSAEQRDKLESSFPGCQTESQAAQVLGTCSRIILAVKPHILKSIASDLASHVSPDHLLVSIAAGISLEQLQEMLATQRIIRVMPNTPCQVLAGASAFSADDSISASDLDWVENLLSSVGEAVRIPDELMHAITGVAGSSPAYVYMVIEALSDGGVAQGLPRAIATRMAAQAVLGAAKMVLETGLHPGALKDQVTSPGGTTIEALRVLEAAGTRSAFIEAVSECAQRSEELA